MARSKVISKIISVALACIFLFGFVFSFIAIKNSAKTLSEEVAKSSESASLASQNLAYDYSVTIPVTYFDQLSDPCSENYYDQKNTVSSGGPSASISISGAPEDDSTARTFEWTSCGLSPNSVESGLVKKNLGENSLPVASAETSQDAKAYRTENRGLFDNNFSRWFSEKGEKSKEITSTIALSYDAETDTFSFGSASFYPLDGTDFSKSDTFSDSHNHLFSLILELPFTVKGGETFELTADDDTWVFVNDELVLDFAGIHSAVPAYFYISDSGEIHYSVNSEPDLVGPVLEKNSLATIRIFHADRDSASSVFSGKLSATHLSVVDSVLASAKEGNETTDENGEVAFDASNYVAPLGESNEYSSTAARASLTSLIVEVTILGILLILSPIVLHLLYNHFKSEKSA